MSEELAPAGSVAQIKVSVTEPKPIIHGNMSMDMDFSFDLYGIALYSSSGTASGVAQRRNGGLQVSFSDPSATFGMNPDYPALTITVGVKPDAVPGTIMPVSLNLDASQWVGPLGLPYTEESAPGWIEVGGTVAVSNVVPGGGILAPGESFRILGVGFQPGVKVQMEDIDKLETTYVNSRELRMTTRTGGQLDGERIRIRNKDKSSTVYFSYLRGTKTASSTVPLFEQCEPIFPMRAVSDAIGVHPLLRPGQVVGLGLQNPNRVAATVTVEALSPFLQKVTSASITLAPGEEFVKSLPEILTLPSSGVTFLRVRSVLAVQIVPMLGDQATGDIKPLTFVALPFGLN